jgi:uncharacterized protein YukE
MEKMMNNNERVISIDGLTEYQVQLLDTMWQIDGYDEYTEWKEKLQENTRKIVEVLESLVIAAELDAETEVSDEVTELLSRM